MDPRILPGLSLTLAPFRKTRLQCAALSFEKGGVIFLLFQKAATDVGVNM